MSSVPKSVQRLDDGISDEDQSYSRARYFFQKNASFFYIRGRLSNSKIIPILFVSKILVWFIHLFFSVYGTITLLSFFCFLFFNHIRLFSTPQTLGENFFSTSSVRLVAA